MKKGYKNIPDDLNAYDEGVKKGVDLALNSEKLDVKRHNPHNPFFSPKSYHSYSFGLKTGFKMGISQREYSRLQQLSRIQNSNYRSRGR